MGNVEHTITNTPFIWLSSPCHFFHQGSYRISYNVLCYRARDAVGYHLRELNSLTDCCLDIASCARPSYSTLHVEKQNQKSYDSVTITLSNVVNYIIQCSQ